MLWVEDQHSNHSILELTQDLDITFQIYLRMNIKSLGWHFKVDTEEGITNIFFIGRTTNGHSDLFQFIDHRVEIVCRDFGVVDEVISYKNEGKTSSILIRRGSEFFRFSPPKVI